jgi:PhnB protein
MPEETVPRGYPTATPHLVVADVAAAIEFYARAFGAEEMFRLTTPGGDVAHAELRIGDSVVMLAGEDEAWGNRAPGSLGGTAVRIHLYVPDADALAERAVAAGATLLIPVAHQFYGDRSGRLADPFGHEWILASRYEDLTPEEMQDRFVTFMRSSGGG